MRKELSVGILTLVTLLAFGYMISRLTQNQRMFTKTQIYYCDTEDATGLLLGGALRVAGINVGRIKDKVLVNRRARMTLEVDSSLLVYQNAYVTIKSLGYLGDRYLSFYPGTKDYPPLKPGSTISSKEGSSLEALMAKTQTLLEQWAEVAIGFKNLLGYE